MQVPARCRSSAAAVVAAWLLALPQPVAIDPTIRAAIMKLKDRFFINPPPFHYRRSLNFCHPFSLIGLQEHEILIYVFYEKGRMNPHLSIIRPCISQDYPSVI